MRKKRVLMTYMESGYGHITSIKLISDSLKKYYGEEFDIIDSYIMREEDDKYLNKLNDFIIKQTQRTNRIKGFGNLVFFLMETLGRQKFMRWFHQTFFSKAVKNTLAAFKRHNPDVIVSTHYYMTYAAIEYRQKINKDCIVITYNPDNNVHPWWDNRDALFIVNNQNALYEAMGKRKFNPERIKQVDFSARDDIINANKTKEEYRSALGIDQSKFCVVIADGAYACAKSKKICRELLKTDLPLTIVMVAGKNQKVFEYFSAVKNKTKENTTLITLKFTPNIYEYYKAADLFISKAGPNALLDSAFMGTPIIVNYYAHPIERETKKLFIDTNNYGLTIYRKRQIRKKVEEFIKNPYLLEPFKENLKQLDKNAPTGRELAEIIYNEITTKHVTLSDDFYLNRLYTLAHYSKFDAYTTPINIKNAATEKKQNDYKPSRGLIFKLYRSVIKLVIRLFGPIVNFLGFRVRVVGRKNLKGIKNGITISNHVHYLDSLWYFQAMKWRDSYITGASHNNKKGFFGATLSAGGFIPLANTFSENKKFAEYVSGILKNNGFIHFYPEQSLWLKYEQSRPFKKGAFYYASKNNAPIIPLIILFKPWKKNAKNKKKVVVQICKPIWPNPSLSFEENCKYMNIEAQKIYDQTVIDFYGYDKENYTINEVAKKVN